MSDNSEDLQNAAKPAESAPVAKPAERQLYPWMQGKDAFLEQNPRNLPPMLKRAYAKHLKAQQIAKKGK